MTERSTSRDELVERLSAMKLRLADITHDLGLATGTPTKWRETGVPIYAVAYLIALEAMDAQSRAAYRAAVQAQEPMTIKLGALQP